MPWRRRGEWRYSLRSLNFDTRWRWLASLTLRPLYPHGNSPRYPLDTCWVGPRTGLNAVAKRKYSCPCWESNPGRPARSLVTIFKFHPTAIIIIIIMPFKNMAAALFMLKSDEYKFITVISHSYVRSTFPILFCSSVSIVSELRSGRRD